MKKRSGLAHFFKKKIETVAAMLAKMSMEFKADKS